MIVADASALVAALTTSGAPATELRRRLRGDEVHAPHLVDVEAASAIRRLIAAGEIDAAGAATIVERLRRWPMRRHVHLALLPRIHALRDSVSSYDAAYVALAEALRVPLVTCDGRLARSHGHRAAIEHHALQ
ncbi:MAG: type II toxin-antitoxin system VapC family toxin [Acidimicrobiales bacterium]